MFIERYRSALRLLIPIVLAGCNGNSVAPAIKKSERTAGTSPSAPTAPADITVSMTQLHADLVAGAEHMRSKYAGKQVELSGGTIVNFGSKATASDPSKYVDTVKIWERVNGTDFGVECEMKRPRPWTHLTPGQSIRIQGIGHPSDDAFQADSLKIQLTLEEAGLINSIPLNRPIQTVTADDLVRQFKKSPQATKDQYHRKPLIIQGQIDGLGPPPLDVGYPFLLLKSPKPEVIVKCESGVSQSHPYWIEIQEKPMGASIELFVESTEISTTEKLILLFGAYEIK